MPPRPRKASCAPERARGGTLRIGDQRNAIQIIALSQSNPLKAVAEFVENSIDAKATRITISRGKEDGRHYLRILDDGTGIPRDGAGIPDFKYVATHVCDSIKRRSKAEGVQGIQGEFGIGLLSFWTIGEELTLRSPGADGKLYQMTMRKGQAKFSLSQSRALFGHPGTELIIRPLLPGLRQLSGEKIQWYLASELRNRILQTGVEIRIIDRTSRSELQVEPRKFTGQRIIFPEALPETKALADARIQCELYLDEPRPENGVGLYRMGTRVLESLTELDEFRRGPWTSGYLQGFVDAPALQLSPGTRLGVIRDAAFEDFCSALRTIEGRVEQEVLGQVRADEEKASQNTLASIQRAFREALNALPPEEYDWFELRERGERANPSQTTPPSEPLPGGGLDGALGDPQDSTESAESSQKAFFEFAGPLSSARISPASALVRVGGIRSLRAVGRDRKGKHVTEGLTYRWRLLEGSGSLLSTDSEIARFEAPSEPGLTRVGVTVTQAETTACEAEAVLTVTDSILAPRNGESRTTRGLPGYTFQKCPGETWRSRYDLGSNLIVVNNGHRDFVFASQNKTLKLRYICRLFSKELVQVNFPGASAAELLERMIEVSLHAEESLR